MIRNKFILAFLGVIFAAAIIFIFYYLPYRKYKALKIDKEYLITITNFHSMKGYTYVNDTLQIPPISLKTGTGYIWLREFIQKGDVLYKKKDSDSIEIKRSGQVFTFSPYVGDRDP